MSPQRVQLRRTKGWRMPPGTVIASRPSKYGNPFDWQTARDEWGCTEFEAKAGVAMIYRDWLTMAEPERFHPDLRGRRVAILAGFPDIRGKNLACWCKPGEPCHADVLLELANAGAPVATASPRSGPADVWTNQQPATATKSLGEQPL